jgi:endonuclease/exonuclease/phosphatase family metal-dependent hydrolase
MRWAWLLVLVACVDARTVVPAPPLKPAHQLRVMSYNVYFVRAGDPDTIDAIASADPDVVFLQETTPRWARALVGRLGATYPHRYFEGPDRWPAEGMGLLSRYPIVAVERLERVVLYFAWRVVLDTHLGPIQVLHVHLRAAKTDGNGWPLRYFATDDDRLREIEYFVEELDPRLPTLIVGDFNEETHGRAMQFLLAGGDYADAIAEHAGKTRTWEWRVAGFTLRLQLDHILHDEHFVAVTAGILEAGNSDHKPVWADLERIEP